MARSTTNVNITDLSGVMTTTNGKAAEFVSWIHHNTSTGITTNNESLY